MYIDPILPVVPLIALSFNEIRLNIEFYDNDLIKQFPSEVDVLYTFLEKEPRRNIAQHSYHLNADKPFYESTISHGFITYRIQPKTGLADSTELKNTAFIYFDFNPAIQTNYTLNTFVDELHLN